MQTATGTRFYRAQALYHAGAVRLASADGLYFVKSASNPHQEYAVRIGAAARCECRDFQARGVVCKHQLAVIEFEKATRAVIVQRQGRA